MIIIIIAIFLFIAKVVTFYYALAYSIMYGNEIFLIFIKKMGDTTKGQHMLYAWTLFYLLNLL